MREHVQALETEMGAERLHVVDQPVAPVGGGVSRMGGLPGPAQIEQYQPPGGESAEVPEVGGGAHRPAGEDDERVACSPRVCGEPGPVVRVKLGMSLIVPAVGADRNRIPPRVRGGRRRKVEADPLPAGR
ncbi:hypothetical protein GCM10022206_67400 [Streptomyces chiangmaiensis]